MAAAELRPLGEDDVPALQALIERAADHYELVYGHPPGPAEAHSTYAVLPEGTSSYDDKLLFGIAGDDGELAGFADVVRDWPEPGTWALGMLLLVPEARGRGLGSRALAALEERAVDEGARRMRLGVDRVNERARAFWDRHGYRSLEKTAEQEDLIRLSKDLCG
jgi:ribosomal protein S18 acetylase RimI-like enzyme